MRRFLRFLVWCIVIVAALIGAARVVAIRFFWVPDDKTMAASVRPNLDGGDLVILWRLTAPSYGELVVCPEPDNPGEFIVGRIMGEAGDVIEIRGNRVVVNGENSGTESRCPETVTVDPDTDAEVRQSCSIETLGSHKHNIATTEGHENPPRPIKDELMEGEIFLVSDNRLYPYDSRVYGAVQRSTCGESVIFRLVGRKGWGDSETRLTYIR